MRHQARRAEPLADWKISQVPAFLLLSIVGSCRLIELFYARRHIYRLSATGVRSISPEFHLSTVPLQGLWLVSMALHLPAGKLANAILVATVAVVEVFRMSTLIVLVKRETAQPLDAIRRVYAAIVIVELFTVSAMLGLWGHALTFSGLELGRLAWFRRATAKSLNAK